MINARLGCRVFGAPTLWLRASSTNGETGLIRKMANAAQFVHALDVERRRKERLNTRLALRESITSVPLCETARDAKNTTFCQTIHGAFGCMNPRPLVFKCASASGAIKRRIVL